MEIYNLLLEKLLFLISACGGNPNVMTTKSGSTLYHVVLANPDPDMELVMKLCEAGISYHTCLPVMISVHIMWC
jgi:hypothetical protein